MRPRIFVDIPASPGQVVQLSGEQRHYLRKVVRLKAGAELEVIDSTGNRFQAKVLSLARHEQRVEILCELPKVASSPCYIRLVQALPRGKKVNIILQKSTELGFAEFVPFISAHGYHPPKRTIPQLLSRWQSIVREACRQCGRSQTPVILEPVLIDQLCAMVNRWADNDTAVLLFHQARDSGVSLQHWAAGCGKLPEEVTLIVGPEGGFSGLEVEQILQSGATAVSLGSRILRCETAAIVAVALAQHLWGDLG